MQSELLNAFDSYMDVYYTGRTADNATSVRQSYIMHVLNHVNKTRDSIIRHSQKIAKQQDDLANGISSATTAEYRDQGFTRPRVLILVPYKNSAFDIVRHMIPLSGTDQQENKKRFFDEYALPADEDTGVDPSKPADFKGMFDGNLDDCFRTGIKFTRRAMKLSTDFYSSDVIIASPLGLRLIIGKNNGGKSGKPKDDYDFLSSIEMVIVDQCDALLMQNWEHVEHVFDHLNLIPQSPHGCDFSRVRSWCLDGNSKYLRQTIVLGNYAAPELSRLITKQSSNAFGRLTFAEQTRDGAVANVLLQIPQAFTRIDCASVEAADDRRFDHFAKHIAPTLKDTPQTIVVVPSYFDYIRVRNLLLKETGLDFAHLSEHSTGKEIARARTEFFSGFAPVLVITERFHFYHRYQIRGARNFIFYQLPENAHYYPEILNFALLPTNKSNQDAAAESRSCVVLFTKYDALRLARVTGDALAKRMISGDRLTYAFT
ncbi:DUF1253-domain-containing protein [Ramicandelaber brevisporus]|nr:DUF1253-domain-containing protein [Ramicandelaber brevisporus]KAI8868502.1 DUF1253-domain-containing protein [Ramicandelaber brevisporus]